MGKLTVTNLTASQVNDRGLDAELVKAWSLSDNAAANIDSYNMSSRSDTGTGQQVFNVASPFLSTNFIFLVMGTDTTRGSTNASTNEAYNHVRTNMSVMGLHQASNGTRQDVYDVSKGGWNTLFLGVLA